MSRDSVRVTEPAEIEGVSSAQAAYDGQPRAVDADNSLPPPPVTVAHRDSVRTLAPHAIATGLLAIAMLVWGGVVLARAEVDDTWRDPIVAVAGINATAAAGVIVAAVGVALLISALARSRGAILFVVVVAGVAALIAAIEPDLADRGLGGDEALGIAVAIGCGVVAAIALAAPTVSRRTAVVERL